MVWNSTLYDDEAKHLCFLLLMMGVLDGKKNVMEKRSRKTYLYGFDTIAHIESMKKKMLRNINDIGLEILQKNYIY